MPLCFGGNRVQSSQGVSYLITYNSVVRYIASYCARSSPSPTRTTALMVLGRRLSPLSCLTLPKIHKFLSGRRSSVSPFLQGVPREFSRLENPAGFHGIRDNAVIPWNFDNPVPVQTDPVDIFTTPTPSRVFFYSDPVQLVPCNLGKSREIRVPSRANPQILRFPKSRPDQSRGFVIPRDLSPRVFLYNGIFQDS